MSCSNCCDEGKCIKDKCVSCCVCNKVLRPNETCCLLRRKILVVIAKVFTEEACGVPESEMAEVIRWDLDVPSGKPVIGFRFCPWCGQKRKGEVRITDVTNGD